MKLSRIRKFKYRRTPTLLKYLPFMFWKNRDKIAENVVRNNALLSRMTGGQP